MIRIRLIRNAIWKRYLELDNERNGDYMNEVLNNRINGVIDELINTFHG